MVQIILSPPFFFFLQQSSSELHRWGWIRIWVLSVPLQNLDHYTPWLPFSHQIVVKHFIADNFRPSKGTCTTGPADPATLQIRCDVRINKTYLEMFLPKRFYDFILTLVIDFSTVKEGRSWNDLQLKLHVSMFLVGLFTRNAWHIKNVTRFSAFCTDPQWVGKTWQHAPKSVQLNRQYLNG